MIEGVVNAAYEAVVTIPLRGQAGQERDIEADAVGPTPIAGMLLVDKHTLTIDVESGGRVVIQASV